MYILTQETKSVTKKRAQKKGNEGRKRQKGKKKGTERRKRYIEKGKEKGRKREREGSLTWCGSS